MPCVYPAAAHGQMMHTYKEEDEKYEARLQYVQAVEELVGDEAKQWYAVNKKEKRKK
jgi:hypothetical protein